LFGRRIRLFSLFGFKVSIDLSWIVIAVLVTWSLSAGVFPRYYHGLARTTYLWMGLAGALGLFVSIIVHEFFHSFVARRFGIQMRGITLFVFGGVAEMGDEPPSARAEFYMAVAGPVTSVVLGLACYGVYLVGKTGGWPLPLVGVFGYLGWINLVLAAFNIIPAFPLDGGRVLRSLLWGRRGDIRWATKVASGIGSGFGVALILLGVLFFIRGAFVSGMWWALIGLFVRGAARSSYQQVIVRDALHGEPISRFMTTDPVSVALSVTLDRLVEDYIYKYHFKLFPVTDAGQLAGCISTAEVKGVPRDRWAQTRVQDVMQSCSGENAIEPGADAMTALARMSRTGASRLMVVDNGKLVGIVALKDLLSFLNVKLDLSGGDVHMGGRP
jgi:Zn-dependent protease/CBS domain-containing protein